MASKKGSKHQHYEILNLIGYGLAKFDSAFIKEFGFTTKKSFFEYIVNLGIAETVNTVKNRQDLFDYFFDNPRKGWWQKGDAYIHRKLFIDSLFGEEDVSSYTKIIKLYLQDKVPKFLSIEGKSAEVINPILKSKFKQLQETGQRAELFFMRNYKTCPDFENGTLQDARTFGDGYDFQIKMRNKYFLVEVKGLQTNYGSVRLTNKEFITSRKYKNDYILAVVSNLEDIPKIKTIFNPTENLILTKQVIVQEQISFHSKSLQW